MEHVEAVTATAGGRVRAPRTTAGPPRPTRPITQIYADESNRRGGYDLTGGLQVLASDAAAVRSRIDAVRAQHGWLDPRGEFKWRKASGHLLLPVYADLIGVVMELITAGRISFLCLATRRPCRPHPTTGTKWLRASRKWCILLERHLAPPNLLEIILDTRTDLREDRLNELRSAINDRGRLHHGVTYECCRTLETRDSKGEDLIQVVDVLLGSVGYHLSRRYLDDDASAGKTALAQRICAHLSIPNLRAAPRSAYFVVEAWDGPAVSTPM